MDLCKVGNGVQDNKNIAKGRLVMALESGLLFGSERKGVRAFGGVSNRAGEISIPNAHGSLPLSQRGIP